jgi:dihydroorotase
MKLQIRGGRVIDPANGIDEVTDVFVAYGRITALGEAPEGYTPDWVIDAAGRYVLPGLVDLAARLRQPGEEHKATIASETRAAAAAGITTLCCPPDTVPPVDSPAEINLITRLAKAAGQAKVFALGALTANLEGELLSEMAALKAAGCLGVSNALRPVSSTLVLRRALEYAGSHELTVFLHPIDFELANHGCAHEGAVASRLGLPGIPSAAETAAIGQQLALIEQTGVRAHFCRVSTARGAAMIQRAQYDGLPITMDVCAHQLYLTDVDIGDFNSLCHTLPPLRTLRDRDGLRQCLGKGSIGAICSDHQPHEEDAKLAPFPATEPGISALETLLPLTLQLADDGVLSLSEAVQRITCGPADILGLDAGTLAVGTPADICIYDPEHPWTLDESTVVSAGKNTPFLGWEFTGRVTHTLVDGRVVYALDD